MRFRRFFLGLGAMGLLTPQLLLANVSLPKLFADGMVVQRNAPIKVWGWADPNEKVTVQFSTMAKPVATKAGKDGKFSVILPAQELNASGINLEVKGKNTLLIKDVLVGDVWVASGQSNMEWPLGRFSSQYKKDIGEANFPAIRFFEVPNKYDLIPQQDVSGGEWVKCSPEVVGKFSAVAYFFARKVHQEKNVPVGVISTEWGGIPAEAFTSKEALLTMPEFVEQIRQLESYAANKEALDKANQEQIAAFQKALNSSDIGTKRENNRFWWDPAYDVSGWGNIVVPGLIESNGLPNFNGILHFRLDFQVMGVKPTDVATLHLGKIDDDDSTYVNGKPVGGTAGWDINRKYVLPAGTIRNGTNTIAIKIIDYSGGGGLYSEDKDVYLLVGEQKISLAKLWKYRISANANNLPRQLRNNGAINQNTPTLLYNAMLAPIIPYTIKGAIWYQGESNAARAEQYRTLFPLMIKDWRTRWGQGDFPFLWVQLANYRAVAEKPVPSDWAELREAQTMTLALPNTGEAVAIDIGEANDIHPWRKKEVGERLYQAARKVAYGENVPPGGPMYRGMKVEGNKVRISYSQIGSGLEAKDLYGYVKGFALAGKDSVFHYAKAHLEGNEVVVYCDKVPNPVAVRYAWADNPFDPNLYSKEGLPAVPFRSDNWPMLTAGKKKL